MVDLTFKLPFVDVGLMQDELKSLSARSTRNPLYKGPCRTINRHNGLALDGRREGDVGDHTCLWQSHGARWQRR